MARLKDTEINGNLVVTGDLLNNNGVNLAEAFSNPNLLINGDFQINQRSATTYSVTTEEDYRYTVDRWLISGLLVTVNDDGTIRVENPYNNSHSIQQKFEKELNGTYTFSCYVENYGEEGAYMWAYSDDENVGWVRCPNDLKNGLNTWTYTGNIKNFGISVPSPITSPSNGFVTLKWCKLEQSSMATPFAPRPYAEEFAMCQRYYHIEQSTINGYIGSSSKMYCRSDSMLSMRITPTILNKPKVYLYVDGQIYEYTPSSVTANNGTGEIVVELGSTTLSKKTVSGYFAERLLLDAEIY